MTGATHRRQRAPSGWEDNAGAEDAAAGVPAARPKPAPTPPQLTSGSQQLPPRRDPHFLAKRIDTVLIRFVFTDKKEHLFTATSPRHSYILNYQQNQP